MPVSHGRFAGNTEFSTHGIVVGIEDSVTNQITRVSRSGVERQVVESIQDNIGSPHLPKNLKLRQVGLDALVRAVEKHEPRIVVEE